MLKNMLLASAAAFVVLGSAASLTNMKAVITSGNSADAALTRDAFDLTAQMNEVRTEQVRHATLMSVQEATIRTLQRDLVQAQRVALHGAPVGGMAAVAGAEYETGLDLPSLERAQQLADYHKAWLQAIYLENDLVQAQDAYRTLEASTGERLAAVELETAEKLADLENNYGFAIARLEEEIEQRDSSIVGLMHRLVSLQGGSAMLPATAPASAASAKAAPRAFKPEQPAALRPPVRSPTDDKPGEERSETNTVAAQPSPAKAMASTAPGQGEDAAAAGSAAYQAGDYERAFEIWRGLENEERNQTAAAAAPPSPAMASTATRAKNSGKVGVTVAAGAAAYQAGDYERAFDIWRRLANEGDTRARFHLGALYYEGRGVARNLDTAKLLLAMAAANGHEGAAAMRDRVAVEMNKSQVATAPR